MMNQEKSQFQAFVFDMDGTIVDTIEDMAISVNQALVKYGMTPHPVEAYKHFIGDGSVLLIKRALGEEHQDRYEEVFSCYYDYYHAHFIDKTHPYDGMVDALNYAKEKGIRLFIYTNKPHNIALEVEEKTYGKGFFDKLVGIPLGGVVKPDPKAFLDATESYHLDYGRVAYFGDSTTDIETAYNLGIRNCFSVLWGYQDYPKLSSFRLQPKSYLHAPSEIKKIVDFTQFQLKK